MYGNLKTLRESLGMTQKEFAKSLAVAVTTYNGYETGARDPKSDFWVAVARKYGVSIDYLMGFSQSPQGGAEAQLTAEAAALARDYSALDAHGRQMTRLVLDGEKRRMAEAAAEAQAQRPPLVKVVPLFGNSFAAGAPEPDFGNQWTDYEIPAESRADFAIHINGDSMEPYLKDGSIALGVRGRPEDGDVGAFLLDGEFLCKQFCQDFLGNIYLFSLNRKRADADLVVWHDSGRNLTYFGKILLDKPVPLPPRLGK